MVSNVLDEKGRADRRPGLGGAGEAVWHTDMSYADVPPDASMLYALEIPPTGGNTYFLSMQAAWANLPEPLKARLAGRRIKHDGTYNSGGFLRKGVTPTDDPHQAPGAWHPATIAHPATGVPALYLGRRRNSYVEGYSAPESDALLDEVWAAATRSQNSSPTSTTGASATSCCGITARPCTGAIRSTARRGASCIAPRSRARARRAPTWRRRELLQRACPDGDGDRRRHARRG